MNIKNITTESLSSHISTLKAKRSKYQEKLESLSNEIIHSENKLLSLKVKELESLLEKSN